jgi:hypothetical protein
MVVRIRITSIPQASEVASGLAGPLTLLSVTCFSMSVWKILADLGWAGKFFLSSGIWSHWQLWIASAVAGQLVSFRLARGLSRERPLVS